jgi:hypothetical protein
MSNNDTKRKPSSAAGAKNLDGQLQTHPAQQISNRSGKTAVPQATLVERPMLVTGDRCRSSMTQPPEEILAFYNLLTQLLARWHIQQQASASAPRPSASSGREPAEHAAINV